RFRASTTAAFVNIDAGSSLSVKQVTGGGFLTLTGTGGVGASFTLNNAATATASSAGQITFAGDANSTLTVGTNQTLTPSGGAVTPGNSVGQLSTGPMTWAGNTTYFFEYSSDNQATINSAPLGTVNDNVNITGALTINATNAAGNKVTINIASFGFTPTNSS